MKKLILLFIFIIGFTGFVFNSVKAKSLKSNNCLLVHITESPSGLFGYYTNAFDQYINMDICKVSINTEVGQFVFNTGDNGNDLIYLRWAGTQMVIIDSSILVDNAEFYVEFPVDTFVYLPLLVK